MPAVFRTGMLVAAALLAFHAQGASMPQLYGAGSEREDSGRADLTINIFDSTTATFWGGALHVTDLAIGQTTISGRTGYGYCRLPRLSPANQELALTVPIRKSALQIVAGYRPLWAAKNRYTGPEVIDGTVSGESLSLESITADRFSGGVNGIVDYDTVRHFLYGMEVRAEKRSGASFDQTIDRQNGFNTIDYAEYGKGDGAFAAEIGVGYWRDFTRRSLKYKYLWLLEGFLERERKTIRLNPGIIPYLLSFQNQHESEQLMVHTYGARYLTGGGRLRFILSSRFSPLLPFFETGTTKRPLLSGGLEHIGFSIGLSRTEYSRINIIVSDFYPAGFDSSVIKGERQGTDISADHSWRFFLSMPWSVPSCVTHLSGRIAYQSFGREKKEMDLWRVEWLPKADLWLGACVLLFRRVFVELSYKILTSAMECAYDETFFDSDGRFDFSYRFGKQGVLMVQMRLLW